MSSKKSLFYIFSLLCMMVVLRADEDAEQDLDLITRGLLSVPNSVQFNACSTGVKIISPSVLGNTTTNFNCCTVYQLSSSVLYTPLNEDKGCPMVRMNGKGATFDLCHSCVTFNRSTTDPCSSHCVGVEVGYSPNGIGSLTQPDSMIIENGIFCNWDIAVLIHAGVRNVTLKNLIFTNNVLPIVIMGQEDNPVVTITLENVSMIGNCQPRLACLEWVRSMLIDGTDFGGGAAVNPAGYATDEVLQLQCNPERDVAPDQTTSVGAYVYTGLYANQVCNMQMKNVSVSNIGYHMEDSSVIPFHAENTVAFGMYLRNCTTLFMEQMESTKTKSSLAAVAMYLDSCSVVSIKEANLSNTFVSPTTGVVTNQPGNAPANCKDGRWAAALVLRDCNVVETCDVVLSKTEGIDRSWGMRTIFNPVTKSNNLGFENITVDFLRGDRVYGFDFGDLLRLDTSGNLIPAGSVHSLKMKNISISSARGKNDSSELNYPENDINVEYKGIFLGDGSKDISIDGLRVESNHIAGGATGISSGVEMGARSTADAQALGFVQDIAMHDITISGNRGGGTGGGRFSGIRCVSRGTAGGTFLPASDQTAVFKNITLSDSLINNNEFDGIRVIDDSGELTPIQLKGFSSNDTAITSSVAGFGMRLEDVANLSLQQVELSGNIETGLYCDTASGLSLEKVDIRNTSGTSVDVYGLRIAEQAHCVELSHVEICGTTAIDGRAIGLHMVDGRAVELTNVQAHHTTSSSSDATAYNSWGIYFENSVSTLQLEDILCSSNGAESGNCIGLQIDKATGLYGNGIIANDNYAEGFSGLHTNVATVKGIFLQAVGSEESVGCVLKNIQACGNDNAYRAYGIHMQEPIGITLEGVDVSSNASDQLVTGHMTTPILCQAIGLYIEGGSAINVRDIHSSANVEVEYEASLLARDIDGSEGEDSTNTTAAIARHFSVVNRSGAWGIVAEGTEALTIYSGVTSKNDGVRACGIMLRDVDHSVIRQIDASENRARGGAWYDVDPFAGLDCTIMEIPAAQRAGLFGEPSGPSDSNGRAYVDLCKAYQKFLEIFIQVIPKENFQFCPDPETIVSLSTLASLLNVIWSTIAQYRRFSSAIGIAVYNGNGTMVDGCRTIQNCSDKDSAAGVAIYGCGTKGHTVQKGIHSSNQAWKQSMRGYPSFDIDGDMNISEWKPLYDFLGVGVYDTETVNPGPMNDTYGLRVLPSMVTKTIDLDPKPTALEQPDGVGTWTLNERKMTVGFPSVVPNVVEEAISLYDFISVGPIAAGIMLEGQRDSHVTENNVHSNGGNAGYGFGILSDSSTTTLFLDNRSTGNEADLLGAAWGLADLSFSSSNLWFKNWMHANRIDVYLNSSFFIVFDPLASPDQALPLQVIQPGSVEKLIHLSPLDNIVVEFVRCRQIQDCVADCIKTRLDDCEIYVDNVGSVIAGANESAYSMCPGCS